MIYLSEILKAKVKDNSDQVVGRLKDVITCPQPGAYAPIQFLVVFDRAARREFFIAYEYVANISRGEVTLKKTIAHIPEVVASPEGVFLSRDIFDEQIVDVAGARVVRVNDLELAPVDDHLCVAGIDISFKGILRRLRLAIFDIFNLFKVNLIDWRKTQMVKGMLQLNTISKDLIKLHPADLANIIEDLALKQGSNLVDSLDSAAAAQIMEEMDPAVQKMIINYLGPERAHDIVERMSVDETVDLLQMMPKAEARKFLAYLRGGKSKKVQRLIKYPDDTAGGLMTTDCVVAKSDWTVSQVIGEIRRLSPEFRTISYVYVVDDKEHLVGTVSLRALLVASPEQQLATIIKTAPPSSILTADQKVREIVRVMTKYNLYTAAVADERAILVGMVTIDDVMRHLFPTA